MNWFSGHLEVKWCTGSTQAFHDWSFKKARDFIDEHANRIVNAMYYPHPTSMSHENFHNPKHFELE